MTKTEKNYTVKVGLTALIGRLRGLQIAFFFFFFFSCLT